MSEPFLGEIRLFAFGFVPKNHAACNGQLLSIAQNQALFSILGTTYGGNGTTNFALPNLLNRVPLHPAAGMPIGSVGGATSVVLTPGQLPAHDHPVLANRSPGLGKTPEGFPAGGGPYGSGSAAAMPTQPTGAAQPVSVVQPFLAVQFCIALQGIYPPRS
jgi:microcystin-dependent protein